MPPEKKPYRRDDLVCIATLYGQLQAQVIKTKLEAAGIPALLQYESYGLVLGLTVDGMGQVRVMVPEALAEEALQVLDIGPDEDEPDACDVAEEPDAEDPGDEETRLQH
jgi:hypothetical protein